MTYVIAEPCVDVKDKACIEECPVDCIYEGDRMLYIQPDECIDCGACEPVCPDAEIVKETRRLRNLCQSWPIRNTAPDPALPALTPQPDAP